MFSNFEIIHSPFVSVRTVICETAFLATELLNKRVCHTYHIILGYYTYTTNIVLHSKEHPFY